MSIDALHDHHFRMIYEESGISKRVIAARGYRTATTKTQLKEIGFSDTQRRVPALVIPLYNVYGEIATYQIRSDAIAQK
jgi:hypothetical protein